MGGRGGRIIIKSKLSSKIYVRCYLHQRRSVLQIPPALRTLVHESECVANIRMTTASSAFSRSPGNKEARARTARIPRCGLCHSLLLSFLPSFLPSFLLFPVPSSFHFGSFEFRMPFIRSHEGVTGDHEERHYVSWVNPVEVFQPIDV